MIGKFDEGDRVSNLARKGSEIREDVQELREIARRLPRAEPECREIIGRLTKARKQNRCRGRA